MNNKSILAGFLIGFAALLSCCIENNLISALAFSIGLLYIRISHSYLFTGQIQNLKSHKTTAVKLLTGLIGNIAGVTLAFTVFFFLHFQNAADKFFAITAVKWTYPWYHYLASGFCCGILMTVATKKESPLWLSILCVMAFILAGFNHCIADWFYLLGSTDKIKYLYWFLVVIGNFFGGYSVATE